MYTNRSSVLAFLVMLSCAFLATGCGEEPTPNPVEPPPEKQDPPPPPTTPPDPPEKEDEEEEEDDFFFEDLPTDEDLDMSYLTAIPCDDSSADALCYNKEAFVAEYPERIEAYRAWQYGTYVDGITMDDEKEQALQEALDKIIEATHELLGSCNYYRDEEGRTRVRCPDEIFGVYACPHMWFQPEMFMLGGIRFQQGEDPICYEEFRPGVGGLCNFMGCSDGDVCSGEFSLLLDHSEDEDPNTYFHPLPVCMPLDMCLEIRAQQGLSDAFSCKFPDGSRAYGYSVIEPVDDCDALEEGLCAINCPCADPDARCSMLSASRPIGMCSTTRCATTDDCPAEEACIRDPAEREHGWDTWMYARPFDYFDAPFSDCVRPQTCEDWVEVHADVGYTSELVQCNGY